MALPPNVPTLQAPTGNWTRPDNAFPYSLGCVTTCEVRPELRPVGADHMPILTELDLTISRSVAEPSRNFRMADFENFREVLQTNLNLNCTAKLITSEAEFTRTVDLLIMTIQETIESEIPLTNPSPHSKRWWTRDLTNLQKRRNILSRDSYRLRDIRDHPVHQEYKAACNTY
ncbi:hypothetical protein FIBSPDRAFT_696262, partial [Athelia psychrophila]